MDANLILGTLLALALLGFGLWLAKRLLAAPSQAYRAGQDAALRAKLSSQYADDYWRGWNVEMYGHEDGPAPANGGEKLKRRVFRCGPGC